MLPWLATPGPSLLTSTLFALFFLWLSAALGHRALRWLGVPEEARTIERLVTAAALGIGVLGFVPLALGAAGLLRVEWVRAAVAAVTLLALFDLRAVARLTLSALRARPSRERWLLLFAWFLVPGLLVAFLLGVTPTLDPDGLGYHLTVPKRWLASGSLSYIPTYPNSNMPMGVEMLFTLGLAIGGDSAAKLIHFTFGALGALGLYLAGKRLLDARVGALAVAIYLFGPAGVGGLLGWAYVEGLTGFAIISSALAWSIWFRERRIGWLRCAAALAGVAVSFKITAGLFPLALGALTLAVLREEVQSRAARSVRSPAALLWLAPLVIAPVSPWLLRAALVTGNPIFPMFARWIPSRDFSPELAQQWEHFNRYMNWAIVFGAGWSLETRKLILAGCALVVVLTAAVASVRLRGRLERAVIVVLAGTVLAQLGAVGLYVRYWVPMLSVLQLPFLAFLASKISLAARWQRPAIVALTAFLSLSQARRSLATVGYDIAALLRTAAGAGDKAAFIQSHIPLFSMYQHANQELPQSSRILLAFYCGGFYIDATTLCADIVQGSLSLGSWSEFVADVRRLGVTHVMGPRGMAEGAPLPPGDASGVGYMVRKPEWEFVGKLASEHGRLLTSAADQGLYAIDLASLPP
jgi:hypothetical protein